MMRLTLNGGREGREGRGGGEGGENCGLHSECQS